MNSLLGQGFCCSTFPSFGFPGGTRTKLEGCLIYFRSMLFNSNILKNPGSLTLVSERVKIQVFPALEGLATVRTMERVACVEQSVKWINAIKHIYNANNDRVPSSLYPQ